MKFKIISIIIGSVIVASIISLSSCSYDPFVSKTETVEDYNYKIRFASEVVGNLGYDEIYEKHYANTYYKYVLIDGNATCPVTISYNTDFKTESDNYNGPIHVNDICIDCGYTWKEHKHRR